MTLSENSKKWLLIGAGFGSGSAVIGALLITFAIWFSSLPKAWDADAIKAKFSTPLYTMDKDMNITGTELEYILKNKTSSNYTLLPDQSLFIADRDAES